MTKTWANVDVLVRVRFSTGSANADDTVAMIKETVRERGRRAEIARVRVLLLLRVVAVLVVTRTRRRAGRACGVCCESRAARPNRAEPSRSSAAMYADRSN